MKKAIQQRRGAFLFRAVLAGCLLAGMVNGQAQAAEAARTAALGDYPNRFIELTVPFAPGGGVDLFGRTVAQILNEQKIVNRSIQVVNKPGAGGSIGMTLMVQRKGDPYNLLGIAIHAIVTPLTLGTGYSYKDMTPIAKVFSEYEMMVVRAESPIKSLKDVEAALKKDRAASRLAAPLLVIPTISRWRCLRNRSALILPNSITFRIQAANRTRPSSAAMSMSAWAGWI